MDLILSARESEMKPKEARIAELAARVSGMWKNIGDGLGKCLCHTPSGGYSASDSGHGGKL